MCTLIEIHSDRQAARRPARRGDGFGCRRAGAGSRWGHGFAPPCVWSVPSLAFFEKMLSNVSDVPCGRRAAGCRAAAAVRRCLSCAQADPSYKYHHPRRVIFQGISFSNPTSLYHSPTQFTCFLLHPGPSLTEFLISSASLPTISLLCFHSTFNLPNTTP